jgi:chromosome partitioning protein
MELIALLGKGGTAKTTSTASLGHAFARRGKKVVLIDLDSQASLSDWLVGERDGRPMVEDVLMGRAVWADALVEIAPNLRLSPTMNFALPEVEQHIGGLKRRSESFLGDHLADLTDVDIILFDTPRGLDTNIAQNIFEAMTGALIVAEPAPMSTQANKEIILAVREWEEGRDVALLLGVLPTRFQKTSLSGMALDSMDGGEGIPVFTAIRSTVKASEAVALDELLWNYDSHATASQDYEVAAEEILGAMKKKAKAA